MSIFDGIEKASSTNGSNYIKKGLHTLKILSLREKKGFKGESAIAEFEVVESTAHETGSEVVWVLNFTNQPEMSLGNLKGFLAAVTGVEEDKVDSKGAARAFSKDQPLAGVLVKVQGDEILTKKGTPFTKLMWRNHQA